MELLPKPSLKDHLHYAIAFVGVLISGALAALAFDQTRQLIRTTCALTSCSPLVVRVANAFGWIVPAIAFAIYILIIQPLYNNGVTENRIWHAQGRPIPEKIAASTLKRTLWENDLYHAATRFLKTVWIPAFVLAVTYALTELEIYLIFR